MGANVYTFETAANTLAEAMGAAPLFTGEPASGYWHFARRAAVFGSDRMIVVESWQEAATPIIEFTIGAPGRDDIVLASDALPSLDDVAQLAVADLWPSLT